MTQPRYHVSLNIGKLLHIFGKFNVSGYNLGKLIISAIPEHDSPPAMSVNFCSMLFSSLNYERLNPATSKINTLTSKNVILQVLYTMK